MIVTNLLLGGIFISNLLLLLPEIRRYFDLRQYYKSTDFFDLNDPNRPYLGAGMSAKRPTRFVSGSINTSSISSKNLTAGNTAKKPRKPRTPKPKNTNGNGTV